MGWDSFPVYGEDLGSAIEAIKKRIEKVETNKFDSSDLAALHLAASDLSNAIVKKLAKDEN